MSPEMRIGGGIWKGRKIYSFGSGYRPTSGIVKKSLFDTLAEGIGGSRFLDLFAGCGAVGLEALSRSAELVCFIENDNSRVNVLKRNLEKLGVEQGLWEILALDYSRALGLLRDRAETFDYIFADPPYDGPPPQRILGDIVASRILAGDGVVVYEAARKDGKSLLESAPVELYPLRERLLGGTALIFFRWRQSQQ
jgi:16S rRNA (guanine966-N2)-methyltransferase